MIIVHGITQCPVHMKADWLSKELGVPVVEGIGAPIRMAAMLAGLGLKHSRKRWPKSNARPNVLMRGAREAAERIVAALRTSISLARHAAIN